MRQNMTPWFCLAIAGGVYVLTILASYSGDFKKSPWYLPVCMLLGSTTSLLWFVAVRCFQNRDMLYIYSLAWDAMIKATFWLIPVLFLGVRLSGQAIIGVVLMIGGIIMLQTSR
jgi:multidrug transporter EmrE-like cation transporter